MADVQRGLCRWVLVLLTALVLVQTLGLLHRVLHAHSSHSLAVADSTTAARLSDAPIPQLQRLWGEHSSAVDCQLFDQSCPDAWHSPSLVVMPTLPAPRWLAGTLRERFALVERFYAARGPPAVLL